MPITVIPTLEPTQARFARWLAVAVLLHGALLLLPVAEYGRRAVGPAILEVALQRPPPPAPETARPEPEQAPVAPPEVRPAPSPPPPPAGDPEPAPARERMLPPEPAAPLRQPDVSAARLLEQARQRELQLPRPGERRRLGVFAPQAPPSNWTSAPLPGSGRFDGRALPERIVIVDRWLAADGTQQVLIETPGGQLLCGRAEAWNPMQPLVEQVMMFRDCGPGTATFEWPEHYRRDLPGPPGEAPDR